ncbi:MAG: ABC transporter substrate-binding protein [Thermoprotei archaeon]|nr:ABC transporter substrate-binding protein [Thermoprotei archaeon]
MPKEKRVLINSSILLLILLTSYSIFIPEITAQVTLPVPREETVVLTETGELTVTDSFNPFVPQGEAGAYGVSQICREYLFYINYATGEYIWWLATGYEYSDDYKTLTFHIRKGVTWNDGEPFTAKDVAFTLNMLKKYAPKLYYSSWVAEWVKDVETPDDYTVVIHLTKPNPRAHFQFRFWNIPIVPEHVWKDKDPLTFKNNPPVYTGPYKLHRVIPELKMMVWVRRDDYWGKELGYFPAPKYVVWMRSPPPEAEFAMLLKGEIDHAHSFTANFPLLEAAERSSPNVTLAPMTDPCPRGIWMNCHKYPLNLKEVRWAIAYCLPYEKVAEVVYHGWTEPARWPWSTWKNLAKYVYDDVISKYKLEYNPDKAKKILDDLDFVDRDGDGVRETPNGTRLSFTIITPAYTAGITGEYSIALMLADELKKIGIDVTVRLVSWSIFDEQTTTGTFDITSHWLCGAWDDPLQLYEGFHSKYFMPIGERMTAGYWCRLVDKEFDEVIDKLEKMSPDDPAAEPYYKQALELYMKNLPAIPVVQTIFCMPFSTKYWIGWPSRDNMYIQPFTWWPTFLFVILNLKPRPKPQIIGYTYVWITKKVSNFTGADGKVYGPFEEGSYVNLPKPDADRLIKEGKASYTPPFAGAIQSVLSRITNLSKGIESLRGEVTNISGQLSTLTAVSALEAVIIILLAIGLIITRRKSS